MKRPLFFNGRFLEARPSGVQRVAAEMLQALDALYAADSDGSRQKVVLLPQKAQATPDFQSLSVQKIGRLPGNLWEQVELPRAAGAGVLVNLCNVGPLSHRGSVTMIHDAQIYISPESYSPAFVAWYKFAMPTLGRRSSHILTVSEYSKRMLVEHRVAPADKVSVIHNGVDHILRIKADHDIVERLQLAPNGFVLALANTQKHKNIDVLFQAFTDNNLADLKLVLVGSASRADFEAKGISVPANAVFAGRVSDSELSGLMERALCFAFPSLTEGFGLPPLEAMLLGCPTVIAPCGALPEVCGSAALQADATNPRSWADAIHRLSVDPALRAQFSALGQAQAKQFVWSESAARLRRLLDQL